MGEPLIKFDYVIVSLSPTCALYLLHLLLSLSFLFKKIPFHSLFKKKKIKPGKKDVGFVVCRLRYRRGMAGRPEPAGAQQGPVRVGALKLLHPAREEASFVWTQPPCGWTGRGLTPGPQASTLGS